MEDLWKWVRWGFQITVHPKCILTNGCGDKGVWGCWGTELLIGGFQLDSQTVSEGHTFAQPAKWDEWCFNHICQELWEVCFPPTNARQDLNSSVISSVLSWEREAQTRSAFADGDSLWAFEGCVEGLALMFLLLWDRLLILFIWCSSYKPKVMSILLVSRALVLFFYCFKGHRIRSKYPQMSKKSRSTWFTSIKLPTPKEGWKVRLDSKSRPCPVRWLGIFN